MAQVPRPGSVPAAVSGLLLFRQSDSTSFKKLSQGWSDSSGKARGRVRRRSKRRACLLLGAWLLTSPEVGHLKHASFSILCVLSFSIWEGHGAFPSTLSTSVPCPSQMLRLSTLYGTLTFSQSSWPPGLPSCLEPHQGIMRLLPAPGGVRGRTLQKPWANANDTFKKWGLGPSP